MLVEVVHTQFNKKERSYNVQLAKKKYIFKVRKKIEEKVKVGMIGYARNKQQVYILNIIENCENENQYTDKIMDCKEASVVFEPQEEFLKRKQEFEEKKQKKQEKKAKAELRKKERGTVFIGNVLELKDKKFKKTSKRLNVRANEKSYHFIKVGDILHVETVSKKQERQNYYVLVEKITDQLKNKPTAKARKLTKHFYRKTEKGYRKVRLDEDLNIVKTKVKSKTE